MTCADGDCQRGSVICADGEDQRGRGVNCAYGECQKGRCDFRRWRRLER